MRVRKDHGQHLLRADGGMLLMEGRHIRPSAAGDRDAIRRLLEDAGLPVADLDASEITFLVADDGSDCQGAIGLERFGSVGLLRSLVVAPARRGTRTGGALVRALETRARAQGLRQLVLLTQTAAPFFAHHGYARIDRATAPAAVQASAEFRALCPASATCMAKSLDGGP